MSSQTLPPRAVPVVRALLSVSDKSGLVPFAQALAQRGVVLLSTGGTAKALREAGLAVQDVSDHTGFPEMMDGRVKTLHPKIHGGLLALRDNPQHLAAMAEHDIAPIDLVVVNLYPFSQTVARGAADDEVIENIDIGGPSMVRSAAKNHASVAIIVDPADYDAVLADMEANSGGTSYAMRRRLAGKAYAHTAAYDAAIADYFHHHDPASEAFPAQVTLTMTKVQSLRYGENPHQTAALYASPKAEPGLVSARQVQGKELSYNNLNDTDAALELISEFAPSGPSAIAIIKHANPCGVATGESLLAAYTAALKCDPVSAFGGIVAANQPLDRAAAEAITDIFTEVVVAPSASEAALDVFARKKNLRLLLTGTLRDPQAPGVIAKAIAGGFLLQSRDNGHINAGELTVVTKRQPTPQELADLLFAFRVAKHVKSNAIVYARGGATVGIGAGQMSRLDSARIAARKAEDAAQAAGEAAPLTRGSVVASDAFFPFADGLLAAAAAGVTAVIQPGGSIRDDEVIAAADAQGLAMVLTGMRHFRH